jgi:hypothetical protein
MPFNTLPPSALQAAQSLLAITTSDSTPVNCRALYVGGAGSVAITAMGDTAAVTLVGVPAGTLLPIACKFVMATNTTATSLVALF